MNGIGRRQAEWIFYRALEAYVTPNSQFISVRNATVSAAADIFGANSTQYLETQRAWEAVGIGTTIPVGGGGGGICNPGDMEWCMDNGGTWNEATCACSGLCPACDLR